MLDWGLVLALGFLGSFGHCAGMCGPLAVAFALSGVPRPVEASVGSSVGSADPSNSTDPAEDYPIPPNPTNCPDRSPPWRTLWLALRFHGLLNLGRVISYAIAGGAIGSLGSLLAAGGQLAGIDSPLRQGLSLLTGVMLVWFGLAQVRPQWLPRLPLLHPLAQGVPRARLEQGMVAIARRSGWWMPLAVGLVWGLIPCGFLYAAQIKAAETGSALGGSLTMLVFGLGTMPTMVLTGLWAGAISRDRRSQLFRLAGWVTLAIGVITLARTSAMQDLTGYGSLLLLVLALIARPIARLWSSPWRYRRAIGVGAWVLALAHMGHMLEHTLDWDVATISFLPLGQQVGIWAGLTAIGLLTPLALTSCDRAVKWLGDWWRRLHLASIPALILVGIHVNLASSDFLGNLTGAHWERSLLFSSLLGLTVALRWRWVWQAIGCDRWYGDRLDSGPN
jgi:sulfite exporter TauE/SafE